MKPMCNVFNLIKPIPRCFEGSLELLGNAEALCTDQEAMTCRRLFRARNEGQWACVVVDSPNTYQDGCLNA